MVDQQETREDLGHQYGRSDFENRTKFHSDGWLVSSFVDNISYDSPTGRNFVLLGRQKDSNVVMNCYEPGAHDYMHAHPGSEHTFLVWKGKLHLTGVEDGEDLTLGPGEFVQIQAGYYYRLHNPGPEPAVYCQFQTIPAKPPKRGTVLFSESRRGKAAAQKLEEGASA